MMIENRTKRGLLTFLIAACSFMNTFMSNSVNLAIPSMAAEFNMSATDSSWIVSMFLLALAALCIPFGRISDLTSRRVIFLAGIACFTVTTFGTLLAWSAASLLAFRLLSGVSAAMIFSSNTPIILDAFPREQGGRALGYLVTGVYLGLATGPVIGGLLTHAFGWRSIFIIATISEAIFFIGGLAVIPNTKKDTTHARRFSIARFDPAGSLVLTAAIVCLMVGFSTFTQSLISKLLII
ncbi:MAG: MFS transporter, partial [Coriobacteriales bacterium]|nr:MFS transporter [Coriobacteriales bacterium]